jgi:hypothetical protein
MHDVLNLISQALSKKMAPHMTPRFLMHAFAGWMLLALSFPPLEATPATTEGAATPFLEQAAGVYKRRFQDALVSGQKYDAEDILEIVPVSDHTAYVRMHLDFYNGHTGDIWGVATYAGDDTLIYDNGESGELRCVLTLAWTQEVVMIRADYGRTPGCRSYHGVRGDFNGVEFARSQRRTIRYLKRLKESTQFKSALDEYVKRQGTSP